VNAAGRHYAGSAQNPVTGEQETGAIVLTNEALEFQSDETVFAIPLNRLVIEPCGHHEVAFSDPEQPELLILTPNQEILAEPAFARRDRLRFCVRRVQERKLGRQRLVLTAVFLAVVPCIALLLSGLGNWTTRYVVGKIPVAWEQDLSDAAFDELRRHVFIVERPDLVAELNVVFEHLRPGLPEHPYEFEFHIVLAQEPNAMALPGGRILVHTGLFDVIERREQLAGVLAHEIAHVVHRHGMRQVVTSVGPYLLLGALIREERGFLALLRDGSGFLISQSYSRESEREADDLAWEYMVTANIDPRGLSEFLSKALKKPGMSGLEESALRALSSHPPTTERIEGLERKWQRLNRKSDFKELKKPGSASR
jgi:beta-barrel assembly-enhancing protease